MPATERNPPSDRLKQQFRYDIHVGRGRLVSFNNAVLTETYCHPLRTRTSRLSSS